MAGGWLFMAGAAFATLLAIATHVAVHCPISPLPLSSPSSSLRFPSNNFLQGTEKLGEGRLNRPEDLCFDEEGILYTVTRDGWIERMHRNGSWEQWVLVGGPSLLGVATSSTGAILVCDADKGLLKVTDEGVTVLASQVTNGTRIRFADDVIEASDGTVYFTDVSSKFGFENYLLDYLEARPNGRLLKYEPSTKTTSEVLTYLSFPNGVALSEGEDYLVVCETFRFRVLKHWLKGEKKGKTDVFIDNLPGHPDNINRAPDGSFWIALLQMDFGRFGWISRSPMAKRILASFPALQQLIKPKGAMVANVEADGKIRRIFDDSDGKVISFVTSAVEFEGYLFLGSLDTNFVGKLLLK
ncbi:protein STRICTOSIDINE SYNTHASE-LIKE 4-like [Carex rostrata]